MRGLEQLKKGVEDVVGIGAYQRVRKEGRPFPSPLSNRSNRFRALLSGVGQVALPLTERGIVDIDAVPPGKMGEVFVTFSAAADFGVNVLVPVLASIEGKFAEAIAFKIAYNTGAHVVFDVMKARARQSSSAPQT